ncbi:type IV secretory system conjugative DNA transfer family protein [Sinorhizobium saheli]|uniref:type IV secretory system conjugative DNA transfer family protein n=1 Tax=Sinorhizobium saheli TaxID=36856 RepID=UPI001297E7AF|nr:type IV secretory system conjugative DNA transfer family protein [Sinorhizobium saheli]MQW85968.1 type IV secretion system DNA-binding domain-containing protein [Sinorhizobium saheli]
MIVLKLIIRIVFRLLVWSVRIVVAIVRALDHQLRPPPPRSIGTHGTARWASRFEQWWHGAIRGEGPILGRGAFGRLVRFSSDGLVMVFAATGSGKGVGIVLPTLLTYKGSLVVTDPKGENYAVTRRHRAALGTVRMLNPTDLPRSDRLNPMSIIRIGTPHEADDAAALAKLMVMPEKDGGHWDNKAISLLKGMILHTLHEPPASRTLATVRRMSIAEPSVFLDTLEDIALYSPSIAAREIAAGFLISAKGRGGELSGEFKSIVSNMQKATEPWSIGAPAGQLSCTSTFDLTDLVAEPTTLYLCVDEDLLDVYAPWMRVMVGCVLKTLTRAKGKPPKRKVGLLLDEVAVLGPLDQLEKQSGLLRAYCTPILIWQSLPQIFAIYGIGAKAFLANASARVFFGVNDNETAQYVTSMVGQASVSRPGKPQGGYWLLDAAEVQRLPVKRAIIKMRNVPYPVYSRRIDYRAVWRWRGRWDSWR